MNKRLELDRINELSVEIHADATVITDYYTEFFATIDAGGKRGTVAAQVVAGVSRDKPALLDDRIEDLAVLLRDADNFDIEYHLLAAFEQLSYYDRHVVTDASNPIAAAAVPTEARPSKNVQLAIENILRMVNAGMPLSSEELNNVTATLDADEDENIETAIEVLAATVKADHPGADAALSVLVKRLTDQMVDLPDDASSGITW